MPATKITTTNVADIDAAWQEVASYLAARGIHKPPDDDDPAFWRRVDALQQRDPAFCRLMSKLAIAVVRSTPSGRDLLAQGARSHLRAV